MPSDPTPERVREWAEQEMPSTSRFAEKVRERNALARQVIALREDLERAAGDFPVPMPEPGTDMAVLLSANVLLRRENATLREIAGQALDIARLPDAEFERLDCGKAVEDLRARLDALGGG